MSVHVGATWQIRLCATAMSGWRRGLFSNYFAQSCFITVVIQLFYIGAQDVLLSRLSCTDGGRTGVGDVTELVVDSENVVIRLPGRDHVVAELRRRNTALSVCGRESVQSQDADDDDDDDGRVLNVSLPEFTEYLLDVFEPRPGGGLEHVQTYAISRVAAAPAAADGEVDADLDRARDGVSAAADADSKPLMDDGEREKLAEKKALGASSHRPVCTSFNGQFTPPDMTQLDGRVGVASGGVNWL